MKFTVNHLTNGCRDAAYVTNENGEVVFRYGTNRECWDFIEKFVNDNKVQSFSVIDIFGQQHDYFRFA